MSDAHPAVRKAAILIDSLEEGAADRLLAHLTPEQAARVRQARQHLGPVPAAERERIIEDFLNLNPLVAGAHVDPAAGVEMDASLVARIADAAPSDLALEPPEAAPAPFAFLQTVAAETIARCLSDEHPQTISLVLAHLPAQRAAAVLKELAAELQSEVLRRLARLEPPEPALVSELEQELERAWLTRLHLTSGIPTGLAAVEAILDASSSTTRSELWERPARADQHLARPAENPHGLAPRPTAETSLEEEPLGAVLRLPARSSAEDSDPAPRRTAAPAFAPVRRGVEFEDLFALDDDALARVFRAAEPQIALLALAGASPDMARRILGRVSSAQARQLERQIERLGPIRLQDMARAQRHLAELAWQLAQQGALQLPQARFLTVAA